MTNDKYLTNQEWVNLLPYATNCAKWAKLLDKHSLGLAGSDLRLMQRAYNYLMRNSLAVHHGRQPKRDMAIEREVSGLLELVMSAELDDMTLAQWWDQDELPLGEPVAD